MNHEYFLIGRNNLKFQADEYVLIDRATCNGIKDAKKWFSNDIDKKEYDEYIISKSEFWIQ